MKSIFHVKVSSLEDLRSEFAEWLDEQATRCETEESLAKTLREKSIASAKRIAFRDAAQFWRDINIDKDETEKGPAS
jgi:hypothetical protein